jgi:membrane protein
VRRLRRLFRVIWVAIDRFNRNDGSAMAGFIAFSGLLSLFPFLIFAATLTGIWVGSDRSDSIIEALFEIAPQHVALTLAPVVEEVLSKQSGEVLTLSALFAIWVASSAVEAFRIAFDRAYAVPDPRGVIENRLLAILLVFIGGFVAALLGVSILFSPLILRFLEHVFLFRVPVVASYLTYAFGVLVFIGFLLIMHRLLPGRKVKRVWPGVLVTTIVWMALAWGFSFYLTLTPGYTVTYGALAGVMITLMFFYLTGATIIYGAEVNAAMHRIGLDPPSQQQPVVAGGKR